MSWWNKIKRYSGMSFGRPQVVGGAYYNRKIRNYIRSGYKSTRDPSRRKVRSSGSLSRKFGRGARRYAGRKRFRSGRFVKRGGKFRRDMMYRSILKYGLTQPATEVSSTSGHLSSIADNTQAYAHWYAFPMSTTPVIWDRILEASQNLAIGSVSIVQQVFLDNVRVGLSMRNNSSQCCNVVVYKCIPRIDLSTTSVVTGLNPTLFANGFTGVAQEAKATSQPLYYDYSSTPYMSSEWCSVFKVKPLVRRCLQPGEDLKLRKFTKVGYLIKKSKYGIAPTSSFSLNYNHLRRNGAIYLVKVFGSITHDESLISYPLSSGTGLKTTMGGFNVDWVHDVKLSYRAPYVTPSHVMGTYSKLPSTTLIANSQQYVGPVTAEAAIVA